MTKQVVWAFREFFFLQCDTKFASKQQRLAKIGTILWLSMSTNISQMTHYGQDTREGEILPITRTL